LIYQKGDKAVERLVYKSKTSEGYVYAAKDIDKIAEQLASYLDIGLTPEEVKNLNEQIEVLSDTVNMLSPLMMECHEVKADRDYWKDEAIKAIAELGEMKIAMKGGSL
jgi:uncharacterized radical SAM superfamily protein